MERDRQLKFAKVIFPIIIGCTLLISAVLGIPLGRDMPIQRIASPVGTTAIGLSSTNNTVDTIISPGYSLFDLNELSDVNAVFNFPYNVTGTPQAPEIITSFKPILVSAAGLVNGTVQPLSTTLPTGIAGTYHGFFVTLPNGTTYVNITLTGNESAEGFLGRYVIQYPTVIIVTSSGTINPTEYLTTPKGAIVSQSYAGQYGQLTGSYPVEINGGPAGDNLYLVAQSTFVLVIQPAWFEAASVLLLIVAVFMVAISLLGLLEKGRSIQRSVITGFRAFINNKILPIFGGIPIANSLSSLKPRRIISSKNLLVLFISCSILMVAIATLSGPSPVYKVYVIAPPTEQDNIQNELQYLVNGPVQIITPSQDFSDFQVMSSVGMFRMIIVSNSPTLQLSDFDDYILPSLQSVPVIVLDSSAGSAGNQINALYPGGFINVTNVADFTSNITEFHEVQLAISLNENHNILGLEVSAKAFKAIVAAEGGLSFALIFLGAMFLGAKIAEPSEDRLLVRFVTVAAFGIFVFYFTEIIYVVTSSILTFPLSLHAVVSGAEQITAVGIFGEVIHFPFGGGSTPRLLAGVLGFFIGAYFIGSTRMFSKRSLSLIVGIFIIILANPFALGTFVFQSLLFFVGSITFGSAITDSLTLKTLLYGVGGGLGGNISPQYIMSAGKILYFAGLAPLAFIKKMGKTTASITLLMCAIMVGDGGVRTGEMTPDKTVVAVLPGLFFGIGISLALLGISALEKYLSSSYVKTRQ